METKLKKRRQEIKMTQQEVIKYSGVSRTSYHRYESGERIPDARTATLIAHALEASVEDLWGGKN